MCFSSSFGRVVPSTLLSTTAVVSASDVMSCKSSRVFSNTPSKERRRGVNPSKGGGGRVGNGPERHQKNQAETLDGKKPAEILDRAAAADASE